MTLQVECPWCRTVHEAHTGIGATGTPQAGDASLCYECVMFSIYTEDLTLRMPTDKEMCAFNDDDRCQRIRIAVALNKMGGTKGPSL